MRGSWRRASVRVSGARRPPTGVRVWKRLLDYIFLEFAIIRRLELVNNLTKTGDGIRQFSRNELELVGMG